MADEAILRIIAQGSTGGGGPASAPTYVPPPAPSQSGASAPTPAGSGPLRPRTAPATSPQSSGGGVAFDPVEAALKRIEREDQLAQIEVEYARLKPAPMPDLGFDPVMEAQKRLVADRKRAAIDAEYMKLVAPEPPFDPVTEAHKRLEADKRRAAIDAEYAKIRPPEPPFDPVEEARKRLEADRKRAEIDAEYTKLKPPPPFDPIAEAEKRRENERRKVQVDAAYKNKYGAEEQGGALDSVLKVVGGIRGSLGGIFGPVVGAVLDVVAGLRKAQVDAANNKREQDLLAEVAGSTRPVSPAAVGPTVPATGGAVGGMPSPQAGSTTGAAAGAKTAKAAGTATAVSGAGAAAATGGAAAAGAGLASAAVPIALVVGAAVAIKTAVDQLVKGVAAAVREVLTTIASADADPAKPIAALGEASTKAGEKLLVLGTHAVIVGETLKTLAAVMQAIDKTAERYGEYNPQIAQAQAVAEIRHVMGDLRRSQQISAEMARYIAARSDLQQKWEDIKVRLLNKLLPLITRILEMLEAAMAAGEGIGDSISALLNPLSTIADAITKLLDMQRDKEPMDPTEQILNNPNFAQGGAWVPDL